MESSPISVSKLTHIGVVVKDVEKTARFLSTIWNTEQPSFRDYAPSKEDLLVGEPFKLKIAFVELGSVILELLQPLDKSIWSEFLETKGEGIMHICVGVSNYDEVVAKLQKQGHKMVAGAETKLVRWRYYDTEPGGILLEIKDHKMPNKS